MISLQIGKDKICSAGGWIKEAFFLV